MVTFLAIAGFFSAGAFVLNKQAEEAPIVDKADAATFDWDGTMTQIKVQDDPGNVRTLKITGTFSYAAGYGTTQRNAFIRAFYEQEWNDWDAQTNMRRYKIVSDTEVYLSAGYVTGETGDYSIFYLPSWITGIQYCYFINNNYVLNFGNLNSFAEYGKQNNQTYGNIGSVVGKVVTVDDFKYDQGSYQMHAVLGSNGPKSGTVTVNKKYLTKTATIKEETVTEYQYKIPSFSSPEEWGGYFRINSSWYSGTTYSGATSTYTIPTIFLSATPTDISTTTTVNIVGKYVGGKIIYFTDEYSWGEDTKCWYQGGTVESSWPGTTMKGMYKNGSNKWVYYIMIPEDTTKIGFDDNGGTGSSQTVDVSLSGVTLDNTNAFYPKDEYQEGKRKVGTWTVTADRNPLFSGEKFYIYRTDKADDSGYAVYFFNKCGDSTTEYTWSELATEVTDAKAAFGTSYKIYEITVPGSNNAWSGLILTRYDSTKTPSTSKWDGKLSQTGDIFPTTTKWTCAGFDSETNVVMGNTYERVKVYSTIYGYHVLTQTNGVCVQAGGTNLNTLSGRWTLLKSEYNELDEDIQGAVWKSTTTGSDSLSKGMARYDYIFHKYGSDVRFDDFIGRGSGERKSPGWIYGSVSNFSPMELITGESETDSSVILIIIASSISILSITALSVLMIKKRKSKEQ